MFIMTLEFSSIGIETGEPMSHFWEKYQSLIGKSYLKSQMYIHLSMFDILGCVYTRYEFIAI
jgi:hypothetical protein